MIMMMIVIINTNVKCSKRNMIIFSSFLYLSAISSPENFLSFIGMDQDPASYFENGLYMTFVF